MVPFFPLLELKSPENISVKSESCINEYLYSNTGSMTTYNMKDNPYPFNDFQLFVLGLQQNCYRFVLVPSLLMTGSWFCFYKQRKKTKEELN